MTFVTTVCLEHLQCLFTLNLSPRFRCEIRETFIYTWFTCLLTIVYNLLENHWSYHNPFQRRKKKPFHLFHIGIKWYSLLGQWTVDQITIFIMVHSFLANWLNLIQLASEIQQHQYTKIHCQQKSKSFLSTVESVLQLFWVVNFGLTDSLSRTSSKRRKSQVTNKLSIYIIVDGTSVTRYIFDLKNNWKKNWNFFLLQTHKILTSWIRWKPLIIEMSIVVSCYLRLNFNQN